MKKKLTNEEIRELIWIDYEDFLSKFKNVTHLNYSSDEISSLKEEIRLSNFLLYKILKSIEK